MSKDENSFVKIYMSFICMQLCSPGRFAKDSKSVACTKCPSGIRALHVVGIVGVVCVEDCRRPKIISAPNGLVLEVIRVNDVYVVTPLITLLALLALLTLLILFNILFLPTPQANTKQLQGKLNALVVYLSYRRSWRRVLRA